MPELSYFFGQKNLKSCKHGEKALNTSFVEIDLLQKYIKGYTAVSSVAMRTIRYELNLKI